MDATAQDFAGRYAALGEGELYEVASDYDSLTDPAQTALRAEFAKRKLQPPLADDDRDKPESRKLVTLRRYRDLSEAIVARSLIESAGIVAYLRDENLVRLDWQLSNFIGGIRLQVEEVDAAAALELLDQPVPDAIQFEGPDDAGAPDFQQPRCPKCGSVEISFEGASRSAAVTSLYLLALPLPAGRETWICGACGARWEDTDTASSKRD